MKLFAIALLAGVACASLDSQYTVAGTITLPYDNIVEPFTMYFDGIGGRQRVEYYNGLDTYVTNVALSKLWQVNPVGMSGTETCIETDGAQALTSMFPNMTLFSDDGTTTVNGILVSRFKYTFTVTEAGMGKKVNTYYFYTEQQTGRPVQYHWLGYDELLGSHYDEYVIDYHQYLPGVAGFNVSTFSKPAMNCQGFPGPGFDNPGLQLSNLFPQGENHYGAYTAAHGRKASADREQYFARNVRYIHMFNRARRVEGASLRLAVNVFADATDAEMAMRAGKGRKTSGMTNGHGANYTHPAPESLVGMPTSVNWTEKGAVSHVKDQGICGSCWSFGTAETIEGAHFLKTGVLANLSQQALMDCSWSYGNNACDGGESWRSYLWLLQHNGGHLPTADSYGPYLMADGRCHVQSSTVKTGATITGYANVTSGSEEAMVDALATKGPLSIAIDAALKSLSFYASGVFYDPACKNGMDDLDHQVLAVGYGVEANGEEYFLVKNSWSVHWGDNGYVKFLRGNKEHPNVCGVATDATYTLM